MSDPVQDSPDETSFISHLVELRDRLLRSVIAIAVMLGILAYRANSRWWARAWASPTASTPTRSSPSLG